MNLSVAKDNIRVMESRSGEMSLIIAGDDGSEKTFHSRYDPVAEAKALVDAFEFSGDGVLAVLGHGLGYHTAELARRYPDAEILAVEYSEDIHELAGQYGPEMPRNTRVLAALEARDVLRQISDLQTRGGIRPLAVFAHQPSVSAFPEYYNPIYVSLKKTESVRLWDRLRYPKFKEDACTVALVSSEYFLVNEVEKAFADSGHRTVRVNVNGNEGKGPVESIVQAVLDTRPDFLLTVNHLGFDEGGVLSELLESIEMPVASWFVDSPHLIISGFEDNVRDNVAVFTWDASYIEQLKHHGFSEVVYLPLAADEKVFRPYRSGKHRKKLKRFMCDISFVGNSMLKPVEEWIEKVDPSLRPAIDEAAELASEERLTAEAALNRIGAAWKERISNLSRREFADLEGAVTWKATMLYRLLCIEKIAQFRPVIHGDPEWRGLINEKNISLQPFVHYYRELPYLYNASSINFNATSRQMNESVNQRVFDVPACGAFLLTDYQKSIEELFAPGQEVITYGEPEEIKEKAAYYLKQPSEREKIALRARQRVLKEHTYRHRIAKIVEEMKRFKI